MQWMRRKASTLYVARFYRIKRRSRYVAIARTIGVSGAIALLAACSDTTGPTANIPASPIATPIPAPMVNVANSLDDMTSWWMPSVQSETDRSNIQQILTGLKAHLNVGNVLVCQQDVTDARGALSRLSDSQQVETAPIGVALDIVQSTLDGLSK